MIGLDLYFDWSRSWCPDTVTTSRRRSSRALTTLFETDRRSPGDGKQPIIYARLKRRRSPAKRAAAKALTPLKA
jgi:hypothetical protein